jgi:hypothetical protein
MLVGLLLTLIRALIGTVECSTPSHRDLRDGRIFLCVSICVAGEVDIYSPRLGILGLSRGLWSRSFHRRIFPQGSGDIRLGNSSGTSLWHYYGVAC